MSIKYIKNQERTPLVKMDKSINQKIKNKLIVLHLKSTNTTVPRYLQPTPSTEPSVEIILNNTMYSRTQIASIRIRVQGRS